MSPSMAIHAIDRYLRDLTGNLDTPMGGKVVVLGGDFRQVLPVTTRAHRSLIIQKNLKCSPQAPHFRVFRQVENMRTGPKEQDFSELLLALWVIEYRNVGSVTPERCQYRSCPLCRFYDRRVGSQCIRRRTAWQSLQSWHLMYCE